MNLEPRHIEAILASSLLRSHVAAGLENPTLLEKEFKDLTAPEIDEIWDAAVDAWMNESPEEVSCTGYTWDSYGGGSWETFPLGVKGVEGAYFVHAQEFDDKGPFLTLAEAQDWLESNYCDFLQEPDVDSGG